MITFLERAVHLIYHVYVICLFVVSVISHFCFEERVMILNVPGPGHSFKG